MVKAVRETALVIKKEVYPLTDKQANGKDFSRSLYVVEGIKKENYLQKKISVLYV